MGRLNLIGGYTAEYKYGTTLERGDVVVGGDGVIRTVVKNQDNHISWVLGGRDGAQLIAHDRGDQFPLEHIHHDAMRANMLVLTSLIP